jgi:hypothetical protein
MESLVVLIHSPLVGPFTWSLVAQRLQAIGVDVLVPTLTDRGETPPPYWQQHAASLQQALTSVPVEVQELWLLLTRPLPAVFSHVSRLFCCFAS